MKSIRDIISGNIKPDQIKVTEVGEELRVEFYSNGSIMRSGLRFKLPIIKWASIKRASKYQSIQQRKLAYAARQFYFYALPRDIFIGDVIGESTTERCKFARITLENSAYIYCAPSRELTLTLWGETFNLELQYDGKTFTTGYVDFKTREVKVKTPQKPATPSGHKIGYYANLLNEKTLTEVVYAFINASVKNKHTIPTNDFIDLLKKKCYNEIIEVTTLDEFTVHISEVIKSGVEKGGV